MEERWDSKVFSFANLYHSFLEFFALAPGKHRKEVGLEILKGSVSISLAPPFTIRLLPETSRNSCEHLS